MSNDSKERGVVIVGGSGAGRAIAQGILEKHGHNVKIISPEEVKEPTIEINGVRYRQKEQKQRNIAPGLSRMMMIATMFMPLNDPYAKKQKERPEVDIIAEYKLIQNKESELSRANREWVVRQFEKNFIKID